MAGTLLLSAAYSVLVAALYAYIGHRIGRRRIEGPARMAQRAFVAWWYALGAGSLLAALRIVLYDADHLPVWLYEAVGQVSLLLTLVALWGLLYYLIYLYTGSERVLAPLTVFYALFYVALLLLLLWVGSPERITDNGWSLQVEPEPDLPSIVVVLFLVFLVGPQIGASVAFIRLAFRLEGRTQKYRAGVVGTSILVWFGLTLIVGAVASALKLDLAGNVVWQVVSRLIGLAAATMILMAYLPPAWIKRRLGVSSIEDET